MYFLHSMRFLSLNILFFVTKNLEHLASAIN